MYAAKVEYVRAGSVEEALALLDAQEGALLLAGGHSLIPQMKLRVAEPATLIDIGHIGELRQISANGGSVSVGALTTHAEVARSGDVPQGLSEAAGMIGDRQVRNRGTVGGNIAHADPASDLPTILTALGATVHLRSSSGARSVPAAEFFVGLFETAKEPGELITSVEVPSEGASRGSAYEKFANPASGYAMVGAGVSVAVENGACASAIVAVGGLTHHATRLNAVEAALAGKELSSENIAAAASLAANDIGGDVLGDIHASEEYRLAMLGVVVKRAITKAAARA